VSLPRLFARAQRLLGKIKTERATTDVPSTAAAKSVELQRLEAIVGKYNLAQEDIDALLTWRHSQDF
jgi:hypothetical protein